MLKINKQKKTVNISDIKEASINGEIIQGNDIKMFNVVEMLIITKSVYAFNTI